jgi:antitoxin HigA-1
MSTWKTTMGDDHTDELPAFEPPHPGEYIRKNVLPSHRMNITELADHLGVTRPTLSALVNGKSDLSLEMPQRLGMAFRNGTRFWFMLQAQRDIWIAEKKKKVKVSPIKNWSLDAA